MGLKLPNGARLYIASVYGTAKAVTAISNDNPAEASSTAHGLTDGTYVQIASGWSELNERIARVDNADTGTFELEGIDTSDTVEYEAGLGVGSVKPISTWVEISQVLEQSWSGNEQQFWTGAFLSDKTRQRQLATERTAAVWTLTLGDDPSLPWNAALKAADASQETVALRLVLKGGSTLLYPMKVSFDDMPKPVRNNPLALTAACTLQASFMRYATAG